MFWETFSILCECPIPFRLKNWGAAEKWINGCHLLSLTRLSVVILWFPLIKEFIAQRLSQGKQLIIALDRTQWRENNILMASAIYQKRALPIFWILLSKCMSQ
jgi:hypothetical protein